MLRQSMRAAQRQLDRLEQLGPSEDGNAEARILTAATRAHDVLDRAKRLDEGSATEIHGINMSPEDQAAFQAWHRDRQQRLAMSPAELEAAEDEELRAVLAALPECRRQRLLAIPQGVLTAELVPEPR